MLDLLTSLTDKSLVVAEAEQGQTRYRLLETIRQYARDRLAESGESLRVRARHGDCFVTLAEEILPKLTGAEQAQWLHVLEEEHDNFRQALTFYAEDAKDAEAGEKGLRLGAALQRFWRTRGHLSEARERLSAVLAHLGAQEPTKPRAEALMGAGNVARMLGDYGTARSLYEQSLTIARALGDKSGIAVCLTNLGNVAYGLGDYAGARSLYEESLTITHELGYRLLTASNLEGLASLAGKEAQAQRSARLWGAAVALREVIGSPLPPAERDKQEREITAVRERLGETAFAAAWAEGQAMTLEQAIEYALEGKA